MTDTLLIGERMYSSWSLRAWLLFDQFDIPVDVALAPMKTEAFATALAAFPPARLVPTVRLGGKVVWESLAIAETLAERYPDRGLWPRAPDDRAVARAMSAEMHAGFTALRQACPMNLRTAFSNYAPDPAVSADLQRIEALWSLPGPRAAGPWLFGGYTIADAMFAPVAARIAGYRLPVGGRAEAYVAAHLGHDSFRRWRAMAFAGDRPMALYEDIGLDRAPWPGPAVMPAEAVAEGRAENAACPFSGRPVAPDSLALFGDRLLGFCNPFCRDKAVADPGAWPALVTLLDQN